ncbi:hypothetical protein D3C71_1524980 [compost metagenome]
MPTASRRTAASPSSRASNAGPAASCSRSSRKARKALARTKASACMTHGKISCPASRLLSSLRLCAAAWRTASAGSARAAQRPWTTSGSSQASSRRAASARTCSAASTSKASVSQGSASGSSRSASSIRAMRRTPASASVRRGSRARMSGLSVIRSVITRSVAAGGRFLAGPVASGAAVRGPLHGAAKPGSGV